MMFSFTCPAVDCGQTMTVEANTREEAIDKLLVLGAEHGRQVHPNMQAQTPEQAKSMVSGGMVQEK
jgi:hypothetical protein